MGSSMMIGGQAYEDIQLPHSLKNMVDYKAVHTEEHQCSKKRWWGSLAATIFSGGIALAFEGVRHPLFHSKVIRRTYHNLDLSDNDTATQVHNFASANIQSKPKVAATDLMIRLEWVLRECELRDAGHERFQVDLNSEIEKLEELKEASGRYLNYSDHPFSDREYVDSLLKRIRSYNASFNQINRKVPEIPQFDRHNIQAMKDYIATERDPEKLRRFILSISDKNLQKELVKHAKKTNRNQFYISMYYDDSTRWDFWVKRHFGPAFLNELRSIRPD